MRVLAFDCALKTGYAVVEKGKVVKSGVKDFTKDRPKNYGALFLAYRRWLSEMTLPPKPGERAADLITYEKSHHRGGPPTDLGLNMTGRVREIAAAMRIPCLGVHTGTLKKATTGKGDASKEDMMNAVSRNFLSRACEDDNEADAIALAMYGLKHADEIDEEVFLEEEKDPEGPDSDEDPVESGEGRTPEGQEDLTEDITDALTDKGDDPEPLV